MSSVLWQKGPQRHKSVSVDLNLKSKVGLIKIRSAVCIHCSENKKGENTTLVCFCEVTVPVQDKREEENSFLISLESYIQDVHKKQISYRC